MKKTKILVTGGAGYIGSHVVKELISQGYENILVVDNLSKGKASSVMQPARLIEADLGDKDSLKDIIKNFSPEVVFHFAAAKDAAESVTKPEKYYRENLINTLNLLNAMIENSVKKIIFSSTAAVYGDVKDVPITEKSEVLPVNPYGWSKLMCEEVMADYDKAYGLKYISFRYFNAAGADIDGKLGNESEQREDLVSVLMEAAAGARTEFIINGVDYDTRDGSPIRDLIHVNDLASAHVLGLDYLCNNSESQIINLGSENGFSVKEAVAKTKEVTSSKFVVSEGPRRAGDIIVSIASSEKAKNLLDWQAKYSDLETITRTAWGWEEKKLK